MSISEWISPLVGRLALAWFFVGGAWARANDWEATLSLMRAAQVPAAPLVLVLAIAIMALGGVALALGYHARHGAMLLFGFVVAESILLHAYWTIAADAQRVAEFEIFARNIAIAGGLLVIVGLGPGPFALDNTGRNARWIRRSEI